MDQLLIRSSLMRVFVFIILHSALGATHEHSWDVEYMRWAPDGVQSVVMGINGMFPGPTILARAGDTVNVRLTNKLDTEGVVIHWHGITQKGTPWADGTAYISQCPINPGETFLYSFRVEKAGTYFYHGHYGMQRSAGLYGLLIVEEQEGKEPGFGLRRWDTKPDGDFAILLSDWWHRSSHEQSVDLSSKPMHWIGEPQTLLINGTGEYNEHCSLGPYGRISGVDRKRCSYYHIKINPNKTYRLRIASSTALASLNLAIGGHKMWVIEADGNYVEPFEVDNIDIHSGESYSVLFTTDQDKSKNFWIAASVIGRDPKTPSALAILNYSPNDASHLPESAPPQPPRWDDFGRSLEFMKKIVARGGPKLPNQKSDRQIILLNTQNIMDGYTKWAINNVSLGQSKAPYFSSIKYDISEAYDAESPPDILESFDTYDVMRPPPYESTNLGTGVYKLEKGQVIDVIIQNAKTTKGKSEIHPWHLHGHDFWVLGYGEGKFDRNTEIKPYTDNPPLRNTAVLFPDGWTAIRFVTDNPGVWAFHCHIEPHLHLGMGVIFAEAVDEIKKIPDEDIPEQTLSCGLIGQQLIKKGLKSASSSMPSPLAPAMAPSRKIKAGLSVPPSPLPTSAAPAPSNV